jgi:hypothetical protein
VDWGKKGEKERREGGRGMGEGEREERKEGNKGRKCQGYELWNQKYL